MLLQGERERENLGNIDGITNTNTTSTIFDNDNMTKDDLIMAFFPCIYFETIQMLYYSLDSLNNRHKPKYEKIVDALDRIEKNRMLRGDHFKKPTAYWFFNITPTNGFTHQPDKKQKIVNDARGGIHAGVCSEERSMISPDYARNFICDFILGKTQDSTVSKRLF